MRLLFQGKKRETVPIFPLQTVLFPGAALPLKIFEVRYVDMVKACLKDGSAFGIALIREGQEVGTPAVPQSVGCLARIAECDVEELGVLKVRAEGLERFRIISTEVNKQGLWDEMAGQITDEVLDAFAVRGTPAELPALIGKRYGDLFDEIMLSPPVNTVAAASLNCNPLTP